MNEHTGDILFLLEFAAMIVTLIYECENPVDGSL
jgi:hypothetical protein